MPNNLLLLPLLSGFLFLHLTHLFRFRAQRLDGYRLLMESAIAGVALVFIGRVLTASLQSTKMGSWLAGHWNHFSPFDYSGAAILCFPLAWLVAAIWNRLLGLEAAKERIMKEHGNVFLKLLHEAEKGRDLISVTLDSRKWYVGLVAGSPNLSPEEAYFQLLPIFSGYRDKDNLETKRTVNYRDWIDSNQSDHADFVITIPLRDVKIANRFDPDLYGELTAPGDGAMPESTPEAPVPAPPPDASTN
jgi:hypothetical protein